jgi:hypothetical protein
MRFYALRIVCRNCGAAALLGGSRSSDLSLWREYSVECGRCGEETAASDARAVDLAEPRTFDAGGSAPRTICVTP